MSEVYWDLLETVRDAVAVCPTLDGVPVVVRDRPEWVPLQDHVIQVIIACREDLAEKVRDESLERGAQLAYEVYVGIIHDRRMDHGTLRLRLLRRAEVHAAVWTLNLATDPTFQVEYDPQGSGAKKVGDPKQVSETWMRFDFTVSEFRTDQPEDVPD